MKKLIYKLMVVGFIALQWGCSSYIYSPSLNLSEKQLEKRAFDLKGSMGKFPETGNQSPNTTFAAQVDLGYGFTRGFNLYATYWSDFNNRGGFALASRIRLMEKGTNQLLIYPKAMTLTQAGSFNAWGGELPVVFLKSFSPKIYSYIGAGYGYGWEFDSGIDMNAIIGHLGAGYTPVDNFRIMVELNPIYQHKQNYSDYKFVLSPTLTLGYIINSPQQSGGKFSDQYYKK